MSNVKHYCDKCNHTVFAPDGTLPPCRENLGDDCEMEQVEGVAPPPKKVTASEKSSTVKKDKK